MNKERKNNKGSSLKLKNNFQTIPSLFIILYLFIIQYSLFIGGAWADCTIRGVNENAPLLCGFATQGGWLYGESEWYVNGNSPGIFIIPLAMDAPEIVSIEFCRRSRRRDCQTFEYAIEQRKFPEQHVTVAPRFMERTPEIQARMDRENKKIREARKSVNKTKTGFLDFRYPFARRYRTSSVFGARRVFNGVPMNPHMGWDIAAPKGTEVFAIGIGTVTLTLDAYMPGKTVIIDHGFGMHSIYIHLDRIDVNIGDKVAHDTVIGTVGATGRVSGPHLHLGLYHNQIALDPELLFK